MTIRERVRSFLLKPLVDKVFGGIAVLPQVYVLYVYVLTVLSGSSDIYHGAIAVNMLISVTSTLIRRTASRITLNPVFWIVTALRSYWSFVVISYVYVLSPTSPSLLYASYALFYSAIAIIVYGRLSLGRNIGFLPARRELVTSGAYRYVRHPLHAGELVFFVSFILRSPTTLNTLLMLAGMAFVIWKSFIEESFLRDDSDYREYCARVRYRWVPGII